MLVKERKRFILITFFVKMSHISKILTTITTRFFAFRSNFANQNFSQSQHLLPKNPQLLIYIVFVCNDQPLIFKQVVFFNRIQSTNQTKHKPSANQNFSQSQ